MIIITYGIGTDGGGIEERRGKRDRVGMRYPTRCAVAGFAKIWCVSEKRREDWG